MAPKELSFRYDASPNDSASSFLDAYKGEKRVGRLLFGLNNDGKWEIGEFTSSEPGVGKALIEELCVGIPGYSLVKSAVTEKQTLQKLRDLGEFSRAEHELGETVLNEEESIDVLLQLKIYHVFHGGGLTDIHFTLLNTGEPVDGAVPPTTVSVWVDGRTP
jgi:hypothetical protein